MYSTGRSAKTSASTSAAVTRMKGSLKYVGHRLQGLQVVDDLGLHQHLQDASGGGSRPRRSWACCELLGGDEPLVQQDRSGPRGAERPPPASRGRRIPSAKPPHARDREGAPSGPAVAGGGGGASDVAFRRALNDVPSAACLFRRLPGPSPARASGPSRSA